MGDETEAKNMDSAASKEEQNASPTQKALEWANASETEQAKLIEKTFWQWHAETHPMPPPRESAVQKAPSRRWWIESPQVIQKNEPGYLCEVCRHIDFRYLVDSPPDQMLDEVTLASLRWVLDSEGCTFCRLVALTIRDIVGGHMVATEVNGKDVMCTLRTLPMENDTSGPRQICLMTVPPPRD